MKRAPKPTPESIEREVRGNVLAQRVGVGTVADIDLPHEFLTRLTDRALRAAFVERFRAVVGEGQHAAASNQAATPTPQIDGPSLNRIPTLAREGLFATACRMLVGHPGTAAEAVTTLETAGFPMELLSYFRPTGHDTGVCGSAESVIAFMLERTRRGEQVKRIEKSLEFAARATMPGFRPTSDSGTDDIALLRLQWATDSYYLGTGDGSCPDLLRGVLAATPGVPAVIIAINEPDALREHAVLVERKPSPTQWARDNALCGWSGGGPAHLTPRFATYKEATSEWLASDDLGSISIPGVHATQQRSPLLFHGGNIILYDDHARSQRVMLVGEAEIARNRGLGLTSAQVLDLFKAEACVDKVVVLPAVSYHIDQEVSVRSQEPDAPVAFVADVPAAVAIIIPTCLVKLDKAKSELAANALQSGRGREALAIAWEVLRPHVSEGGGWPLELAMRLRADERENGVANLQRLLAALDELTAICCGPEELGDPFAQAFVRSLKRRTRDRVALRAVLAGLGLKVLPVPAMPTDGRGVNPLNMVHSRGFVLMPTVGGLLATVDAAAAGLVGGVAGVEVRAIASGESQCRDGGVRCSVAAYGCGVIRREN